MLPRIVRRLFAAVLVLVLASLVAFAILDTAPGDAAQTMIGESASQAELAALRSRLGLDQPLLERYLRYAGGALRGDLGQSLISSRPVTEIIGERFANTLALALVSTLFATTLGVLIGTAAAAHQGSWADLGLMALTALGISVPGFGLAMLFTLLFSLKLHLLPVAGGGTLAHLVLPALTLGIPLAAMVARLSRASLLDIARADFVLVAHAKGLPAKTVWHKHILRNALIPVITLVGLNFGHLLGGAFVVESIFGWPGLGRLIVQSIFDKDYPVILGAVLLLALIFQLFNLLIDLAHGFLDPRVGREAL